LLLSRFAFVDIWFLVAFQMYFVKLGCDCLCFLSCSVFFFVTGIYIINLGKTWEKLLLAARVIVAIENPQDIIVQSARPYGQRAVLKFAQYTGAHPIAGRHTPGTFTNQLQTSFSEPRLLILTDPRTDHQVRLTIIYISCSWWLVSAFWFSYFNHECIFFLSCSQSRKQPWEISQPLLSVTLTHQCGLWILVFQPITRGSTALDAYFGFWQGWFSKCVALFVQGTSGMWWWVPYGFLCF